MKQTISEIKKLYTCHKVGELQEYLGITIQRYDKHTFLLSQPDTINKLDKTFLDEVSQVRMDEYIIPAKP